MKQNCDRVICIKTDISEELPQRQKMLHRSGKTNVSASRSCKSQISKLECFTKWGSNMGGEMIQKRKETDLH